MTGSVDRAASVNSLLSATVGPWLNQDGATEICVNRPGEVWIERRDQWKRYEAESVTYDRLRSLATAVARYDNKDVSDTHPILSAILPAGERVQIVIPPVSEMNTISVTIRKPSADIMLLDQYKEQGFFNHVQPIDCDLSPNELKLSKLKDQSRVREFLSLAVQMKLGIVVAGETGSGKTTLMKALMHEIPSDQRIITIEDVSELLLPAHPNHVHLFYQAESATATSAEATPTALLKSCMRMKPSRIMLAELRGGETYEFLNVVASGHGGSITSCHAGSCEMAFERLALMVLQNNQGRSLPYEVIRRLLYLTVDVVVHVHNDIIGGTGRHITEIWYQPARKRQIEADPGMRL